MANGPWTTMSQPVPGTISAPIRPAAVSTATNPTMNFASQSSEKVLIPLMAAATAPSVVGHQFPSLETGSSNSRAEHRGSVATASAKSSPARKPKNSRSPRSSSLPEERLQRCRERNRIHARKTRLRKKEHMQSLQQKSDDLKQKQMRLKQIINEKNTASILLGFAGSKASDGGDNNKTNAEDPRVEELLRRPAEEIPDSTKIPELPALILPGQHASKKAKAESDALVKKVQDELPSEGFDLELLAKDRSKCTPEELDQIRRERNRMHAKRTRDRKRLFMEEMGEICRQLEEENDLLRAHLKSIDPDYIDEDDGTTTSSSSTSDGVTPIAPAVMNQASIAFAVTANGKRSSEEVSSSPGVAPAKRTKLDDSGKHPNPTLVGTQMQYLLEAAGVSADSPNHGKPKLTSPRATGDSASSALLTIVQAITEGSPTSSPKRRRQQQTALGAAAVVGC